MTGNKRVYNIESKNYYDFFGLEQKYSLSIRSLTIHYKKICSILKKDPCFLNQDRLYFAKRAFEILSNPIERARYLISLHNGETDIVDGLDASGYAMRNQFKSTLQNATDVDELNMLLVDLKEHSDVILDNLEESIDINNDYQYASSLVAQWYTIQEIYLETKNKLTVLERVTDGEIIRLYN